MHMRIVTAAGVVAAAAVVIAGATFGQPLAIAQTRTGLPMFEVDAKFPQMPDGLVYGAVSGVAADRQWTAMTPRALHGPPASP